jgi:DNA polymerase III epsilon subunit-like protein
MTVFDMEADGLNPTKIHCLSYKSDCDVVTLFHYDEMREFLLGQDTLIGHNIQRYDIPHLERLLGISIKAKLIDTLALSWYLYPERLTHGLEDWGTDFGVPKPKIDDWDSLTPEEYGHRCEEDVKINTKLWEIQLKALVKLYGSVEEADRLITYLEFKMDCAREQERSRWKLDIERCLEGIQQLQQEYDKKYAQLAEAMPQVPIKAKRSPPKKPYKMDKSLSATGLRWKELTEKHGLPFTYAGDIQEVTGYKDPNPGSTVQIKDWLFSMGWKPTNFKYTRNKETNEFKKIPQVKAADEVGVCPSVRLLETKEPRLQALDGMSIIAHRLTILRGFIDNVDDEGYVKAQIQGITNTLRFKHKVVVNLPGVDKPYGGLVRGCLVAPDGYELCGSDMSSLEDRTKQHYMWAHDPDYVKAMMTDDFDPHLDIGVEGGMMTEEEAQAYKEGHPEIKKRLHPIRHDAKQVNYSCTYGITPEGLVRNNGWPIHKARKLHQTYWKRNWSLEAIANEAVVKTVEGQKWLYNPVSKLWYSLRAEKDRFSTLNQGTGTYCFDTWVKHIRSKRPQLTGQMHDEIILTIKVGNRHKCEELLQWAIEEANKELKLNRQLDVDVQFGNNYGEIH